MGRARRDRSPFPWTNLSPLAGCLKGKGDGSGTDQKALLLASVEVLGGDGDAGSDVEVEGKQLAPSGLGRLDPDDPLSGQRVLDCISRPGHRSTLPAGLGGDARRSQQLTPFRRYRQGR